MILILRTIGVPEPYIRGLYMMFCSMRRSIQLGHSMGPLLASTTGIAEGCSFSVACMCALSFIAAKSLECIQGITPVFFADNWSVISKTIEALQQALRKLEELADAFKMTFSPTKSWVWTSAAKIPVSLKKLTIQNGLIPVQNIATDLGCDITYRGRIRKTEAVARMEKTKKVCKNIKSRKLPMKFKRTAAKLAAQGACMYGKEIGYTTPKQWHTIRSNTAAALNQNSCGSSPWLALCCMDVFLDPQCRFLLKMIKFWRRTLTLFPTFKTWFFHRIAHLDLPKISPCWFFRQSFLDVGWTCDIDGRIIGFDQFRINWFTGSYSHIKNFLQQTWSIYVSQKVSHRKFVDIPHFDVGWHNAHFKTLNERQQGLILTYHSGKHFTGDFLKKFVADNEGKCVACGQEDSREHQLLFCDKMHDLRLAHPAAVKWLSQSSSATKHFALCPWDPEVLLRRLPFCNESFPFSIPVVDEFEWAAFTDGSAHFPSHWDCTCAGGAFVASNDMDAHVIHRNATPLPGSDHSSYRAEVFSILLACNKLWKMHIHSDCSSALLVLDRMIEARSRGSVFFQCEHWDIWQWVWQHVLCRPANCLRTRKVKAHVDPGMHPIDSRECWECHMNNVVDQDANCIAKQQPFASFEEIQKIVDKRENCHANMREACQLMLEIGVRCIAIADKAQQTVTPSSSSHTLSGNLDFDCLIPRGSCIHWDFVVKPEILETSPYTTRYVTAVIHWLRKLQWPETPSSDDGISLLELYVDCFLECGLSAPVQVTATSRATWGGHIRYELRSESIRADSHSLHLSEQSRTWTRVFKWLVAKSSESEKLQYENKHTLKHVGYRLLHASLNIRPKLVHGSRPSILLHRFFHTSHGKMKNLKGDFFISQGGG